METIINRPKRFLVCDRRKKGLRTLVDALFQMRDTLVEKGPNLSLDQCPKTNEEKERMSNVLYASMQED